MYDTLKRHPKHVHTKVFREAQLQLQILVFIFTMIIMTRKILKTKITLRRYLPKTASTYKNYKRNRKKDTYH